MIDTRPRDTARLATAVGAIAIGSAACLGAFFAVGRPFGSINDIGNATVAVLSATLAGRLRCHIPGRAGDLAVGGAVVGAGITWSDPHSSSRAAPAGPSRARVQRGLRRHRRVAGGPQPE